MGLTVLGMNPSGGEILHTCPDQPQGPTSLLYNEYWGSFPEVEQPGHVTEHPSQSSNNVRERLQLYLCSLSVPSWQVKGELHFFKIFFYMKSESFLVVNVQIISSEMLPIYQITCTVNYKGWQRTFHSTNIKIFNMSM
jgi:hypothetical protein